MQSDRLRIFAKWVNFEEKEAARARASLFMVYGNEKHCVHVDSDFLSSVCSRVLLIVHPLRCPFCGHFLSFFLSFNPFISF